MAEHSLLAQIFARDPRKLARFPDLPLEQALVELDGIRHALAASAPAAPPAAAAAPPALDDAMGQAIGSLATSVWRAKTKMVEPDSGEPREEMRRAYRHVQSALEALQELGVTLKDEANQPYDSGLPVKVITFQPTPGLAHDTILEVVRPTVIWRDQLLQMGEVVVGIPENSDPETK
jgi:hypothetical protein